jgi:uncharacterized protein YpmS
VKWKIGYDKLIDTIEAASILKLVGKSGAFYTVAGQKFQGKEKAIQALATNDKLKATIEKDIQTKIKEMRMGKKVLDDDALVVAQAEVEEDTADIDAIVESVEE